MSSRATQKSLQKSGGNITDVNAAKLSGADLERIKLLTEASQSTTLNPNAPALILSNNP